MGAVAYFVCGIRVNAGVKPGGFASCLGKGEQQYQDECEEEN